MSNGVVFAVAGAKGGVGKTTTSINLCAVLAEVGQDAVLIELDLAMANVGDFLDLDVRLEHGRDPTLHEVLSGTASVADATYEAPGGFDVIPSGVTLQGFARVDFDAVADVVSVARSKYSVVVLDTGAGLGKETILPLSLADETVLVSSPRVASVRDTKKTRDLVRHTGGTVAGVVFVKSGSGRSPGVDRIAEFLSVDLLGHVPEDSSVASAQDIGRPVVVARTDSDAARAYRALGSHVHERVGRLKADQTHSEERADGAEAEIGDETQPSTGHETTNGATFTFGDERSEPGDENADATTAESPEETVADTTSEAGPAVDAPSSAGRQVGEVETTTAATQRGQNGLEERTDGTADVADSSSATNTSNAKARRRVRTQQSDITDPKRLGRRRPDADRKRVGASDDEIADKLAKVEANGDRTDQTAQSLEWSTNDHLSDESPASTETDTAETPPEDGDSWESRRSATKRFIDRAIDLVDRGSN